MKKIYMKIREGKLVELKINYVKTNILSILTALKVLCHYNFFILISIRISVLDVHLSALIDFIFFSILVIEVPAANIHNAEAIRKIVVSRSSFRKPKPFRECFRVKLKMQCLVEIFILLFTDEVIVNVPLNLILLPVESNFDTLLADIETEVIPFRHLKPPDLVLVRVFVNMIIRSKNPIERCAMTGRLIGGRIFEDI